MTKSHGSNSHNQPISNWLQKLGLWATIIGAIVASVLSGWAIHLTHKYGENRDQIDTLSKLVTDQRSILKQITKQAKSTDSLLGAMKSSNDRLGAETDLLRNQLALLVKADSVSGVTQNLEGKAASISLKKAAWRIFDVTDPLSQRVVNLKSPGKDDRIAFIVRVQRILESQFSNRCLLLHPKLLNQWSDLYVMSDVALVFQMSERGEQQNTVDGKTYTRPLSYDELEQQNIKAFEDYLIKCRDLYFEVYKEVSDKHKPRTVL